MITGRPPLLKLISVLLIAVVAFSAQAWASHVDWPAADGGAHVETTALDGASTASSADADEIEHGDHCGHASAHLVGLHACHAVLATDAAAAHDDARGTRYESVIHTPLIDPPIA
ncbi:hypothetical protein [Salinisphaera orenii]|uniref:hypothetical protein n=1 Tax=Salinisphaera orenii TaxID=856731 RepID=UPI000F4AE656|nr:hypothetical protein [Salinisphaera halophila]